MKLTRKGQVTIPRQYREQYGLHPHTEVEFAAVEEGILIRPAASERCKHLARGLEKVRGCADTGLTSDEILKLTRGE